MHKEMRRKDRLLSNTEALAVLDKCKYGILSTVNAAGEPYGVPISYAVINGAVYIHSSTTGEKLDNLACNPTVCFTVVGDTEPTGETGFSTYYESCIVFGKAREITDVEEKTAALKAMAMRYLPEFMHNFEREIQKEKVTRVFAISLDRVTGKSKKKTA